MIYTVTLNPALDYMISVDQLKLGNVNRMQNEAYLPGGKGINVSIVLNHLETKSVALGFLGGFSGKEIERLLTIAGIKMDMILVEGNSRINVKIKSNEETEINAMGPLITSHDLKQLKTKINQLNKEDILVLSGSIPKNVEKNIYYQLASITQAKVVLDTTGAPLMKALECHPFLIKPNIHELSELANKSFADLEELYQYLLKLQNQGAQNIIVSMSKDGALFLNTNKELYYCKAQDGVVRNSVGAGDSMVAGFIYQFQKENNLEEAFRFSCATGSASAFSDQLASAQEIMSLFVKQRLVKLK